MKSILLLNFRQLIRSKFIIVLLIAAILVQFLGLKLLSVLTIYINETIANNQLQGDLIKNQSAIVTLFLQCFTGGFLAFCFGTFLMPYLHTGSRAALTFCQPIPKHFFPIAYLISLVVCQIFLAVISLLIIVMLQGFSHFTTGYPWGTFLLSFLLELLAFSTIALLGGVLSIRLNKILSFLFLGAGWFILMLCESIVEVAKKAPDQNWAHTFSKVLYLFPPVGRLVFHLFDLQAHEWLPFAVWGIWFALLFAAFRWTLNSPLKAS